MNPSFCNVLYVALELSDNKKSEKNVGRFINRKQKRKKNGCIVLD
jgi:hypothetical protein